MFVLCAKNEQGRVFVSRTEHSCWWLNHFKWRWFTLLYHLVWKPCVWGRQACCHDDHKHSASISAAGWLQGLCAHFLPPSQTNITNMPSISLPKSQTRCQALSRTSLPETKGTAGDVCVCVCVCVHVCVANFFNTFDWLFITLWQRSAHLLPALQTWLITLSSSYDTNTQWLQGWRAAGVLQNLTVFSLVWSILQNNTTNMLNIVFSGRTFMQLDITVFLTFCHITNLLMISASRPLSLGTGRHFST